MLRKEKNYKYINNYSNKYTIINNSNRNNNNHAKRVTYKILLFIIDTFFRFEER